MKLFIFILGLAIFNICYLDVSSGSEEEGAKLRETLKSLDPCITQAVISFIYKESYPPTTIEDLKKTCKNQNDGFKCIKERSKSTPAILKRGLLALVQSRQRHNKKFCTNFNSELSKQFVRDMKCIVDKKLSVYKQIDAEFANTLLEISAKNFNNSAIELKYLCCSIIGYRRSIIDSVGPECSSSKQQIEELIMSIVPSELNLICEDEDHLTLKVCPTLAKFNVAKSFTPNSGNGPSTMGLYLIATLGEPETGPKGAR